MRTRISVITPSYNQAKYLDETLRSVLCQRDQIHEYIVLDGGSTDGSADIIKRYADKGITYWHSQKDKGQAHAIDDGIRRATGDVICWLNSDDVFLPGALKKVREAFDAHADWDVLTGYHLRFDADSRIITVHKIPGESTRAAQWGVIHVAQQTCFFKKALYERVGGIDLNLHCVLDTELWYRMFDADAKWGHIPEFLAAFRRHEETKGSSWGKQYAAEYAMMNEKYTRYRGQAKHAVGLALYRVGQVLTGRDPSARLMTRSMRGKRLVDVFGDWKVPA